MPTGGEVNLLRCNGPSHPHRNRIEGERFGMAPHIHRATERYQQLPHGSAEGFAQPTDAFYDLHGAFWAMCELAHVELPPTGQPSLFGEQGL